jgi:hypothetical protein
VGDAPDAACERAAASGALRPDSRSTRLAPPGAFSGADRVISRPR